MWPLGVYTHHSPLITRMSQEPSLISSVITGIKAAYFKQQSYRLIALIARALRICSRWNLWTSKQKTDMCIMIPDIKEGRPHPAEGRGIFTKVLRTEFQVAAGKSFVVPWWGIGVFDLDLCDCCKDVATLHILQFSIKSVRDWDQHFLSAINLSSATLKLCSTARIYTRTRIYEQNNTLWWKWLITLKLSSYLKTCWSNAANIRFYFWLQTQTCLSENMTGIIYAF